MIIYIGITKVLITLNSNKTNKKGENQNDFLLFYKLSYKYYSSVVGSIISEIRLILLAGNPP